MSRTGWGPSSISSTVEEKCHIKGHYLLKNSYVVMEHLGKMQNCELNIGFFIHPEKSWSLLFMDALNSNQHHATFQFCILKCRTVLEVLPDMKSSDTFSWLGNLHTSTLIYSSHTLHRYNCIPWCSRWFILKQADRHLVLMLWNFTACRQWIPANWDVIKRLHPQHFDHDWWRHNLF